MPTASKPFRYLFNVPLYGSRLLVSVSDDLIAARRQENKFLGSDDNLPEGACHGLTCWRESAFGIFFERDLDHGVIGHEIFHVTHRILEGVGITFTPQNHEPFTYLNQYLTERIYRELKRGRVPID